MIEGWTQINDEVFERVKAPLGGIFKARIHCLYNQFQESHRYTGIVSNGHYNLYTTPTVGDFEDCAKDLEKWYLDFIETEYKGLKMKEVINLEVDSDEYKNFIRREYGRIEYGT